MDFQLLILVAVCIIAIETKSYLLLDDVAVTVGKHFLYQIGDKQFLSTYRVYRVVERGQKGLPDWLKYVNSTSQLIGSPQESDVGRYTMRVRAECINPSVSNCQDRISRTFHIRVLEPLTAAESRGRGQEVAPVHVGVIPEHGKPGGTIAKHEKAGVKTNSEFEIDHKYTNLIQPTRTVVHGNDLSLPVTTTIHGSRVNPTESLFSIDRSSSMHDFPIPSLCSPNEVSFFASLILHVVHGLSEFDVLELKEKMSSFSSRDKHLISITKGAAALGSLQAADGKHILTAGPGNIIDSLNNSIELSWPVVCNDFDKMVDFTKVLQHNVDGGRITEELGFDVIAWFAYSDRPVPRRQKRAAHRQGRQTGTPSYVPPQPTTVSDPLSSIETSFSVSSIVFSTISTDVSLFSHQLTAFSSTQLSVKSSDFPIPTSDIPISTSNFPISTSVLMSLSSVLSYSLLPSIDSFSKSTLYSTPLKSYLSDSISSSLKDSFEVTKSVHLGSSSFSLSSSFPLSSYSSLEFSKTPLKSLSSVINSTVHSPLSTIINSSNLVDTVSYLFYSTTVTPTKHQIPSSTLNFLDESRDTKGFKSTTSRLQSLFHPSLGIFTSMSAPNSYVISSTAILQNPSAALTLTLSTPSDFTSLFSPRSMQAESSLLTPGHYITSKSLATHLMSDVSPIFINSSSLFIPFSIHTSTSSHLIASTVSLLVSETLDFADSYSPRSTMSSVFASISSTTSLRLYSFPSDLRLSTLSPSSVVSSEIISLQVSKSSPDYFSMFSTMQSSRIQSDITSDVINISSKSETFSHHLETSFSIGSTETEMLISSSLRSVFSTKSYSINNSRSVVSSVADGIPLSYTTSLDLSTSFSFEKTILTFFSSPALSMSAIYISEHVSSSLFVDLLSSSILHYLTFSYTFKTSFSLSSHILTRYSTEEPVSLSLPSLFSSFSSPDSSSSSILPSFSSYVSYDLSSAISSTLYSLYTSVSLLSTLTDLPILKSSLRSLPLSISTTFDYISSTSIPLSIIAQSSLLGKSTVASSLYVPSTRIQTPYFASSTVTLVMSSSTLLQSQSKLSSSTLPQSQSKLSSYASSFTHSMLLPSSFASSMHLTSMLSSSVPLSIIRSSLIVPSESVFFVSTLQSTTVLPTSFLTQPTKISHSSDVISASELLASTVILFTESFAPSTSVLSSSSAVIPSSSKPVSSSIIPTTTAAPDQLPKLQDPIDHLEVYVGRYFEKQIPEHTFNDTEDGSTSNLNLSISLVYGKKLAADSWLKFDPGTQTLYGLPLMQDLERGENKQVLEKFILTAADSLGQIAKDVISITYNHDSDVTHDITMTFEGDFVQFEADRNSLIGVAQRIAKYYDDSDLRFLTFSEMENGSIVINWGNNSLFGTECQREEIQNLFDRLVDGNSSVSNNFTRLFSGIVPTSASLEFTGVCLLRLTTLPPAGPPLQTEDDEQFWLTIGVPALVIILIIIIVALLLLICCRHKRPRKDVPHSEKPAFLEDRRPIIFPEELEMMDPSLKPKNPLILPSDYLVETPPAVPPHGRPDSIPPRADTSLNPPTYKAPVFDDSVFEAEPALQGPPPPGVAETASDPPPYRLPPPYYNPHRAAT